MEPRTVCRYIAFMLVWIGFLVCLPVRAEVVLSSDEQDYLTKKQSITLCTDPDWLPYEGIDEKGRFTGIMSDFYDLWSDKIKTPIELVTTSSWEQSLQFVQAGQCDILASAQDVPSRREWLNVTRPFIFYPLAVATQPDHEFVVKFEQIRERDFVMVEGYAGVEMLRNRYPHINIRIVDTPRHGLKQVETGQAYGYIDTVPTINYQMLRWGISHLKISGVLDQQYAMSVGVSTREPQLLDIFNKVITDTTEMERQRVLANWLSIDYPQPADNALFWQLLAGILLVLLVLVYRYWQMHHHNRNLLHLNTRLEQISQHDHLTGLANRYALYQRFTLELDAANLLKSMVRENDLVGRWGCEEFLILCSQTSQNGALRLAEQMRLQIQQYVFNVDQLITASFGVSEFRHGEVINDTIKRADEALYRAKDNGRNQIVTADSD